MNRSDNKIDTNWKREWDEEQRLSAEELKQRDKERAEEEQIYREYAEAHQQEIKQDIFGNAKVLGDQS